MRLSAFSLHAGFMTTCVSLLPFFQTRRFRAFRASLFAALGLWGIAPGLHALLLYRHATAYCHVFSYQRFRRAPNDGYNHLKLLHMARCCCTGMPMHIVYQNFSQPDASARNQIQLTNFQMARCCCTGTLMPTVI